MVASSKCQNCHNTLSPETANYSQTRHANPNGNPTKFFDQPGKGSGQAYAQIAPPPPDGSGQRVVQLVSSGEPPQALLPLFKANKKTAVTRTNRLEDCSVCHNYAMVYSQYKSNLGTDKLTPQVGCAACHDAHIPAPSEPVTVDNTVQVTLSGSTVTAVTPVPGRPVLYRDLKPYKLSEEVSGVVNQAQDVTNRTWSRGTLLHPAQSPDHRGSIGFDATRTDSPDLHDRRVHGYGPARVYRFYHGYRLRRRCRFQGMLRTRGVSP